MSRMFSLRSFIVFFFFQAEDGIRDVAVTGVQTCALPISCGSSRARQPSASRHVQANRSSCCGRAKTPRGLEMPQDRKAGPALRSPCRIVDRGPLYVKVIND